MNKSVNDLKKEQENYEGLTNSFNANPVKVTIEHLFAGEFSGRNYKKFNKESALRLIDDKLNATNCKGSFNIEKIKLQKKIHKCTNVDKILLELNNYLFSYI